MHVHTTVAFGRATGVAKVYADFIAKMVQTGQYGRRAAIASVMNR
jgi:hypothetical protein